MLEKQVQLQICEASLRLANDSTLSKSAIRAHKQSYEVAQQKLLAINQNISKLKKQQNARQIRQTQDDINLHKSPNATPVTKLLSAPNTTLVDRRHLTKSNSVTNSPSTSHKQPLQPQHFTLQPRTRHDSIGTKYEYELGKMSPISPSATYHSSYNYHHQSQQQSQLYQYPSQSTHLFTSPPTHFHYTAGPNNYPNPNRKSPSLSVSTQYSRSHHPHNTIQLPVRNSSPPQRPMTLVDSNGNPYVTGGMENNRYSTHTLPLSPHGYYNQHPSDLIQTPIRPESSLVDRIESVQQAPGGYWLSMANNERIWFPLDNK